jgi:hypothetical protein
MLSPLGGEGAWMDRRRFLVGVTAGLLAGIAGACSLALQDARARLLLSKGYFICRP